MLSLGFALLAGADALELARPHMRVLAPEIGAATVKNGEDGARLVKAAPEAIDDYARDGCCYSFRDWHADVNAIAAPLRNIRNGRWLVLSSSGPASSMDEAYFRNIVAPKLRTLAARLA